MIERLLIVAAFTFVAIAAYGLWRVAQRRRLMVLARDVPADVGGEAGTPTILYFTAPDCAQCRLRQAPILEQLLSELDHPVLLRKLDALEYDDLARHYGILTVPTTVILDAAGRPRAVNHGLATADRLRAQLHEIL